MLRREKGWWWEELDLKWRENKNDFFDKKSFLLCLKKGGVDFIFCFVKIVTVLEL